MDAEENEPILAKRDATFEDYAATEEGVRAQLIEGELWIFENPVPKHQQAYFELGVQLAPARHRVDETGWVILPNINLKLGPRNVFGPDLSGWRRSRMPQIPDETYIELVPDWVCEILSRSTRRFDMGKKRLVYAKAGVEHLWFVDPRTRTVDVFGLADGKYHLIESAERNDKMALAPFLDIKLDVSRLWNF